MNLPSEYEPLSDEDMEEITHGFQPANAEFFGRLLNNFLSRRGRQIVDVIDPQGRI